MIKAYPSIPRLAEVTEVSPQTANHRIKMGVYAKVDASEVSKKYDGLLKKVGNNIVPFRNSRQFFYVDLRQTLENAKIDAGIRKEKAGKFLSGWPKGVKRNKNKSKRSLEVTEVDGNVVTNIHASPA
jgi:hypothetical protein